MYEEHQIITYPDPRLRKISRDVATFDAALQALAQRMFTLMRESKGVGLAAPQIGENVRLFISNHTGNPEDDVVYVNPQLFDAEGEEVGEEGCLSIPNLHVDINRPTTVRLRAQDLSGKPFERSETGYLARIWQHELDHLNGTLIIDRMGPGAKIEHRKLLRELEDKYEAAHPRDDSAKSRKAR